MPVLENGQRFHRYRIVRSLGNGCAGESYEAEEISLQQRVTLKIIHPWTPLPEPARYQCLRELRGISLLNHSHLAAILDYGECDGRLYVARRYVNNGSLLGPLGRLEYQPPLPLVDAITYICQLARVLHTLHSFGYAHGAVTLSNILVLSPPPGRHEPACAPFLLADAGLSDFVRRCGQPRLPLLAITAAPEQFRIAAKQASDQYALAVLLYFWLAGRPPYLGSPAEVEQLKLKQAPAPLSSFNSGVTAKQEHILSRALAADPGERYPSILAFADALAASQSMALPQPEPQPAPDIFQPPPHSDPPDDSSMSEPLVARLIIARAGAERCHEFLLEREETWLGRAGSDDILLNADTSTSRHHALLKRSDGQYVIYDQRSSNGVFVNNQKLSEGIGHCLVDGDHISIGTYELIFHYARSLAPAAIA